MNKKQNPLSIRAGDVVQISFQRDGEKGPFLAKVTGVTDRTMMGQDAHIDYEPEESARDLYKEELGIPYGCSVSYVVEVVTRASYTSVSKKHINIFRDDVREGIYPSGYYRRGGVMVGYSGMQGLVVRALASAKGTLDRPLNPERFLELWEKDRYRGRISLPNDFKNRYGFLGDHNPYVAVRWKTFKNYVHANTSKILLSQKEMEEQGRESLMMEREGCGRDYGDWLHDGHGLEEEYIFDDY